MEAGTNKKNNEVDGRSHKFSRKLEMTCSPDDIFKYRVCEQRDHSVLL